MVLSSESPIILQMIPKPNPKLLIIKDLMADLPKEAYYSQFSVSPKCAC